MTRKHHPVFHEHFLNDLLELLPIGVIIIDDRGGTIHINRAAKRIWGAPEPGRPFWTRVEIKSLLTGKRIDPAELAIMRALSNGDAQADEEVELVSAEEAYFVHNSSAPIRDPAGNIIAAVTVSRDITRRIARDRQIRASEAKYRYLFENNPRPMWVYDRHTLAFLAVNDAAIAHYGYSRQEFLDMTIAEIHPPAVRERLIGAIREASHGPGDLGIWKQQKKDGIEIDAQLSTHDIHLDGREAALVSMTDVTERTSLTHELSETRQALEEAVNDTRTVLWSWNIETGELIYSRNATAIFGLSAGSHSTTLQEQLGCVPVEDAEEIREQVTRAVSLKGSLNVEFRYRSTRTGKELWIEARGHFSFDHTSRARFLRGVMFDVTDRRQIEEIIRANEKRFRQIVENSPSPQVMLDESGTIQCVSRAAAAKLGYSKEELIGRPALALVFDDQRSRVQSQTAQFLAANKDAFTGLVRVRKQDRSVFWVEVDVSTIRAGHAAQGYLLRFAELDLGPYSRSVYHPEVQTQ